MNTSILTEIKKLLGIDEAYTHFDTDIIISINSALAILNQIGIGEEDFVITSKNDTWEDFIDSETNFFDVKTFVYIKTKLLFDPPQSGTLIDLLKVQLDEITWRLNVKQDKDI